MIPYLETINPSGKADPVFPNFRIITGVFILLQRKREAGTGSPLPQERLWKRVRGAGAHRPAPTCNVRLIKFLMVLSSLMFFSEMSRL